jgi:DNA-nicking Smr family endonuclease
MPTPRRKNLTEADRALWASYASRISPLPCHARAAPTGDDAPVLLAPTPRSRAMAAARSDHHQSAALAVGTHPGGVDSASWHRFRTGRLRAARTLDLHGFTAERAFRALSAFLRSAHSEGLRCVEVVTGQGGVLRQELPHWLNLPEMRPMILGAVHPRATNPGSVRLLLRRTRRDAGAGRG